jgi:uncharacterized membrane protein YccC
MLRYGLSLGVGAAIAYLIAVTLQVDHPGWAPAACLLVARPAAGLLKTRAVGRIIAVTVGAFVAAALVAAQLSGVALATAAAVTVIAAAATRTSRWYITPAFTTLLVFVLMLRPDPEQSQQKVAERIGETLLGVALAAIFAIVIPQLAAQTRQRPPSEPPDLPD